MIKNKKLLYLLLPLVLCIWGFIGYKIYYNINNKPVYEINGNALLVSKDNKSKIDTFTIKNNYRDPFLNGAISSTSLQLQEEQEGFNDRAGFSNIQLVVFPDLKYFGIITNTLKKQKVALVRIQGKDNIVREGDLKDNILIYRMYNDSLIIKLKKNKKTIFKNK